MRERGESVSLLNFDFDFESRVESSLQNLLFIWVLTNPRLGVTGLQACWDALHLPGDASVSTRICKRRGKVAAGLEFVSSFPTRC